MKETITTLVPETNINKVIIERKVFSYGRSFDMWWTVTIVPYKGKSVRYTVNKLEEVKL